MKIEIEHLEPYHIATLEQPEPPFKTWGEDWYPDIDKWCEETFGETDIWGENPVSGWKRMLNKYFFIDENKLALFVMRWSGC